MSHCEQCAEKDRQLAELRRTVHRANMKNVTHTAQIRMLEDQRDSWLPWWFRQGVFKFLRRRFPLTRKFLRQYLLEDYVSPDTFRQIRDERKANKRYEKERNAELGRNSRGVERGKLNQKQRKASEVPHE